MTGIAKAGRCADMQRHCLAERGVSGQGKSEAYLSDGKEGRRCGAAQIREAAALNRCAKQSCGEDR